MSQPGRGVACIGTNIRITDEGERVRRITTVVGLLVGAMVTLLIGCQAAGGQSAQETTARLDADSLRQVFVYGLEQHRAMDTAYVNAVPDSALRWAYSGEVRDYAEQIEHIAVDNVNFVARGVKGEEPPSLGDTAVYLNDKEELERVVNASYDYVLKTLRELPDEELLATTELFDHEMAKWRVFQFALQHADWTRGQLVPYLRMHGVRPPRWKSY